MKLDSFTEFVLDQLGDIETQPKPMFGGVSLYHSGTIFGMTYKGELYLRGDEGKPFEPKPGMVMKKYTHVPAEIIENKDQFANRARQAIKLSSSK